MEMLDKLLAYTLTCIALNWVILEWIALFLGWRVCVKCFSFWSTLAMVSAHAFNYDTLYLDPIYPIGAAAITSLMLENYVLDRRS